MRNLGKDPQLWNLPVEGEQLVADYLQEQLSLEDIEGGLAESLHQAAKEKMCIRDSSWQWTADRESGGFRSRLGNYRYWCWWIWWFSRAGTESGYLWWRIRVRASRCFGTGRRRRCGSWFYGRGRDCNIWSSFGLFSKNYTAGNDWKRTLSLIHI